MLKKMMLTAVFCALLLSAAQPAFAFPTLVPEECAGEAKIDPTYTKCEKCDINVEDRSKCCCDLSAVERVAVNIIQIILGLTGALALLMFVIGGIVILASGGNSKMLARGREILVYAVIGLAIILFAGVLVKIFVRVLTGAGM